MKTSAWEKIKWLLGYLRELRKKSFPLAILGTRLIIASITLIPVGGFTLNYIFPEGLPLGQLQFSSDDISMYTLITGALTFIIGATLIYIDIKKLHRQARNTAKVLITGMLGTSNRFPTELLSKTEQLDARETVKLGIEEEESKIINKQVEKYNANLIAGVYKRFILNHDCNKVYLGGLARIPFLVAYGACFRAVNAKVVYFDRFHRVGDWELLNDENNSISIAEYDMDIIKPDSDGNIGLAIGFSTPILRNQLPRFISDYTLILAPQHQTERNLIKNQENLHQISEEIQKIVDHLSSLPDSKQIHLFLSVQSTLALDIGRRYQEGIHKNWVIHNFNANLSEYEWAIELSEQGISKYQ